MNNPKDLISDALRILNDLKMPKEQLNDRTAICLLALVDVSPERNWQNGTNGLIGIRGILDFARQKLDVKYAENTRESIRKYSIKQLVAAGIALHNPDKADRAVNSSDNCYQVSPEAFDLLRSFNTDKWKAKVEHFLDQKGSLAAQYAKVRDLQRIPVRLSATEQITLSAGVHSELIAKIITEFGSIFVPSGILVYVGDTGTKWGFFDQIFLSSIGVEVGNHGKMPDVVLYHNEENWLILIEAVASSGPVDSGRHEELASLFRNSTAGIVYVTAFPDRGEIFRRYLSVISWETEVWCASDPTHLIHFNGSRFLGPYK